MRRPVIIGIAAIFVLAVIVGSSLFTVNQTEQALITQFGQPIRLIRHPGLHAKAPFVQTVILFDRRLLDYNMPGEEVILGDQRRLIVDAFARFRITDPLRYYQAVGASEEGIRARLDSVVSSSLRRVLGGETLLNVLSTKRDGIMRQIRGQVNHEMTAFGVQVVDVRIRRADLPQENTDAILTRMQSERERVARQARAEGAEGAAKIRANADRDRTVLLANARSEADKLRGEGEHGAIGIYAAAFDKDPKFFAIWRTLQAYRDGLANPNTSLVLTPDDAILKLLQAPPSP